MNKENILSLIALMEQNSVVFESGLSNEEVSRAENIFNIFFPPDLKEFLQAALPVKVNIVPQEGVIYSSRALKFPNWRESLNDKEEKAAIRQLLHWPLEGVLFDIDKNIFWHPQWGVKPADLDSSKKTALKYLKKCPKLIPLYSHRYIPSFPLEAGNPVFSVYQTDVVYYGNNLPSYFAQEFGFKLPQSFKLLKKPKDIPFWSNLVQ